ncbi:hypothetical protein B566_EDAN008787 [Ephemera danica]|nr:hypothetical protein B566_EDAN008787 [Ephemera danica]
MYWTRNLKSCPDPGLNRGPLDLQSNALPTELSRLGVRMAQKNYTFYTNAKKPYESLTKLSNKYGRKYGLFVMRLGGVRTVVISDPKLIRQALARDEFSGRAPLYLTHGIMHGYGE